MQAFAAEHIPAILAGSADWQTLAPSGSPYWRPGSEAELRRKIASQAGPGLAPEYNFVIGYEDVLVGECSIHATDYRNRVAQIGICIWQPEHRRQGFATQAVAELTKWATGYLGLRRLEAWVVAGSVVLPRRRLLCIHFPVLCRPRPLNPLQPPPDLKLVVGIPCENLRQIKTDSKESFLFGEMWRKSKLPRVLP